MTKQETVHVAFRSKETGRYLFHVKWSKEYWDTVERAAAAEGQTVEEFIIDAITMWADNIRGER